MNICILVFLTALTLFWSSPGFAQSRAKLKEVDQRLQRVERVMDQSLLELVQQVDSLQREIRQLRGEIEGQANTLAKLKKNSRALYLDTDQRLTDLEASSFTGLVDPDLEGIVLPDVGSRESELASEPAGESSEQEKAAYSAAYDLLASGKNQVAVDSFRSFLRDFPDGPYSDNAWYWQGEALYAQRLFDKAIENFMQVVDFFPDSRKVPDARLKVGFAHYESGRFKLAREILNAVNEDFPGRSAGELAAKRLQSMDANGQ